MKTAVLFSLAFLVLAISFLDTASGCDCLGFVNHYKSPKAINAELKKHGMREISPTLIKKGAGAVCKEIGSDLKAIITKIPCSR